MRAIMGNTIMTDGNAELIITKYKYENNEKLYQNGITQVEFLMH